MSLEEFRAWMSSSGKPSAETYYYILKKFAEWLMEEKGRKLEDFTPPDVEEYMNILARGSVRTANLFLSAIRKYSEWLTSRALTNNEDFEKEQRRYWMISKMIRMKKVPRVIKKEALTPEEVEKLLDATLRYGKLKMFAATIVHFYFGWRPREGSEMFNEAQINWNERYMIIKTAKVGDQRILPWDPRITPYLKLWKVLVETEVMEYSRPREWFTHRIKPIAKRIGLKVTAKTARKTFETEMRKAGVEQWAINFLLGHTTQVPDIYTDWTSLTEHLRRIMSEKHYLLPILEKVEAKWMRKMKR